jgi:hypothetical protein
LITVNFGVGGVQPARRMAANAMTSKFFMSVFCGGAERLRSGDDEREVPMTRQMPCQHAACIRFVKPVWPLNHSHGLGDS